MAIHTTDHTMQRLVDLDNGHISREIFVNEAIYQQEADRKFKRPFHAAPPARPAARRRAGANGLDRSRYLGGGASPVCISPHVTRGDGEGDTPAQRDQEGPRTAAFLCPILGRRRRRAAGPQPLCHASHRPIHFLTVGVSRVRL